MTYDELEPYYDRFEYLLGTSGKAGNLKGQIQQGGDPHESPRSRDYPTPPQKEHYSGALFRKAATSLGYHPFPQPSSNLSQPYTNPEGGTPTRNRGRGGQASAGMYNCHGPDGSGVALSAPALAGQLAPYLAAQLKSWQQGSRKNDAGNLMSSVAARLDDADIAAVTAYFAGLK